MLKFYQQQHQFQHQFYQSNEGSWIYHVKDKSIAELKKQLVLEKDPIRRKRPGAPEVWAVKGLKEGTTEVTFNYCTLLGGEEAPKTVTYVINVDADLNTKVTEKKTSTEPTKGTIILNCNESTGCEWKYNIANKSIAEITGESTDSDYLEGDIKESIKSAAIKGAWQTKTWSVKGLKEGWTTVTFNYARPWDEKNIIRTVTYSIDVDSDLNVEVMKIVSNSDGEAIM